MAFEVTPDVYIRTDANGVVRHLRHLRQPYVGDPMQPNSRSLAMRYLQDVAYLYRVDGFLAHLDTQPSADITTDGTEIRFFNGESLDGVDTIAFSQTHFGSADLGRDSSLLS